MKRFGSRILVTALVMGMAVVAMGSYRAANVDGKSIFTGNKCNTCHSITSQGVAKSGQAEVQGEHQPPDLSGVGLRHNADWMKKYLLKQESLDGSKHLKKFKGSDEELSTLVNWLATLKKK